MKITMELPSLSPRQKDLFALFRDLAIETTTVAHEPTFTVAQSQAIDKALPGGHTKNLFLKCKKGGLYLITALNDTVIELKSLHRTLGSGRLSFAKAELLEEVLGVQAGSVTPFALINDTEHRVQLVLDARMEEFEYLNFHPLDNRATTNIARSDLMRFIKACGHEPRVLKLAE